MKPQIRQTSTRPLRVVLIDDKGLDARMLAGRLAGAGPEDPVELIHRPTLAGGLRWLQQHPHDVVLLDPSLRGHRRERAVREVLEAARPAPVVVITARHDAVQAERYFRLGVQDYVVKADLESPEFPRRLRHAVERQRAVARLERARRRAEHSASHDALTGVLGRAAFLERARQAMASAQRRGEGLAVLFADLDGFKQVNDSFGHQVGDRLLAGVARRLASAVRAGDTVARLGGDEFVILAERIESIDDAESMARDLTAVLTAPIPVGRYRLRARASFGVAVYPADGDRVETLLRHADRAMYRRKRHRARQGLKGDRSAASSPASP